MKNTFVTASRYGFVVGFIGDRQQGFDAVRFDTGLTVTNVSRDPLDRDGLIGTMEDGRVVWFDRHDLKKAA